MITAILLLAFANQDKMVWNIYEEGHGEINAVCQYLPDTKKVICYSNLNFSEYASMQEFKPGLIQYELRTI